MMTLYSLLQLVIVVVATVALAYCISLAIKKIKSIIINYINKSNEVKIKQVQLKATASAPAPLPPGDPDSKNSNISSKKLYEKGKVRVEVEIVGNNVGEVHLHSNGVKYNLNLNTIKLYDTNTGELAARSVQKLLNDPRILDAFLKGLKFRILKGKVIKMKLIKTMQEWFRKYFFKSSLLLESLSERTFILNPNFKVCISDKNDEIVFLDIGREYPDIILNIHANNTIWEGSANHYHLFFEVKKRDQEYVRQISLAIAKNIKRMLELQLPEKKFVVYLDINFKETTIVRFHQIWENEELYYEPKYCKEFYESGQIRIIK